MRTCSGSAWRTARGEDGGDAGRVGEGEEVRGVRAAPWGALGAAVVDDLDGEAVAGQQDLPRREEVAGPVASPG